MARENSVTDGDRSSLRDRLRSSVADLDAARLQGRFQGLALTSIADCPERTPMRIGGEVRSHHMTSSVGAPALEVTISDGTGTAVARFNGRRRIGGIHGGRAMVIEGVGRRVGDRIVVHDPAYTLLP